MEFFWKFRVQVLNARFKVIKLARDLVIIYSFY
jgi:hypothetical protein